MLRLLVCLSAAFCAAALCSQLVASDLAPPDGSVPLSTGVAYIVLAVDTEPASSDGPDRRLALDFSNFGDDSIRGYVGRAMADSWRTKFTDSFGGNPKLTWYALTSEHICESGSCTALYDQIEKFSSDLERWGDEIGWHYHHTDFVKCSRPDRETEEWNQLTTFNGTSYTAATDIQLCENVLNRLIADRRFFPVSFRSGWVWENDDFSRWLENVVPFDLSSSPPFSVLYDDSTVCRSNESDWSRAPKSWFPYHPDSNDYQRPGTMARWLSRTLVRRFDKTEFDSLAANTFAGRDQIVSVALHSYSNICNSFGNTLTFICSQLSARGVRFRFVTSAEAFKSALKLKQGTLPTIKLHLNPGQVDIRIAGDIFQTIPYVVVRAPDLTLKRVIPRKEGRGHWIYEFGVTAPEALFVAVTSLDGRSIIQTMRPVLGQR